MSKLPSIIAATIKRMIAYVLSLIVLGIIAYKLKLDGAEGYLLNALLVLVPLAIAEYRVARAELLLARALESHQLTSREESLSHPLQASPSPYSRPSQGVQELDASRPAKTVKKPTAPAKVAAPRAKINFPVLLLLKIFGMAAIILLVAFFFYLSEW